MYCVLCVVLLFLAWFNVFAVRCVMRVVRCVLCGVRCSLLVVCCVLCAGCPFFVICFFVACFFVGLSCGISLLFVAFFFLCLCCVVRCASFGDRCVLLVVWCLRCDVCVACCLLRVCCLLSVS